MVNKVLQEIDEGELPLFAQNGQICKERKLTEDLSISRDAIKQRPDKLNCAVAATLMTVAEKDPGFIPSIINTKSTNPMTWSVDLHRVDANGLKINIPVKIDVSEKELGSSRYANLYADNTYQWPVLLSAAIDKALRSSTKGEINGIRIAATSHIMSTLFGDKSLQAKSGVLPGDQHLPPRQLAKRLINQWHQLSQSIPGNIRSDGTLGKPCTFGFESQPAGRFRDQPDFYPGHAFTLEGFDMSDSNNPQILLRQPFDLEKPIDAANREDRIVRVGPDQLKRYLSNPEKFVFEINIRV